MTPVPRFKYFVPLSKLFKHLWMLLFANMQDVKQVHQFETKMSCYFNRNFCTTFSSLRMAVYYYLKSLRLPPGSEILLTPITIPDLINVIRLLDLVPIFVDMDLETHGMSATSLEQKISPHSKCIILTYLSGIVMTNDKIKDLAEKNHLLTIEDISQSYGSSFQDGNDPYWGHIQVGSLSSGKVLTTYTGGFLVSNDEDIIHHIESLKSQDLKPPPKIRFFCEIVTNIKISLATSRLLFPLTYLFLWILWNYCPNKISQLSEKKPGNDSTLDDVFFNNGPTSRVIIPKGWKTFLNSWQAKVGEYSLGSIETKTYKRKKMGQLLLRLLDPHVKKDIPKGAQSKGFNFYHLPLYTTTKKEKQLKALFDLGIDSEGYGLSLCTEELAFPEYSQPLEAAEKIKYHSIFIPIHESFSEKKIYDIAKSLNLFYSSTPRKYNHASS